MKHKVKNSKKIIMTCIAILGGIIVTAMIQWLNRFEKINWGDYTYGQVIDELEIKYIKSEGE